MPGLVPPARPKPLRRGEGPGIHVLCATWKDVDGRDKPGHDAVETVGAHSHISYAIALDRSRRVCPGLATHHPRDWRCL
ncbi:hypothetical protein XH96_13945 [Bradyrhizobium sp. CCBAU 51765]|nr:hypothetical protein XH96_13945 [Bradyrhizobium sp. CCBAU 51765]